ncbi:class I SAM-dependent methyltransferase [Rugosimonospora africana]|uniref:Methyltransferase n=1 Tax=Rugosimonospora africana TaxID=556532 RepID=A0A8J3VR37_9ACTN|nr:class I SAM-dependent methyltransferase [Rugosimonospora africana]GIH14998.1 methyltransferase [Rugosimonospora africana]
MGRLQGNEGNGPGTIAPDGSPVDYYALLASAEDAERVHTAIPEKASILELGAGAGRVTKGLVALGHRVVAVDESAEMLDQIEGAETVCSPIQSLSLGRRFDLVLMMSYLIETADDELRPALLRACAAHVAPDGCVILQRQPPEWYDTAAPFERTADGGRTVRMVDVRRPGPGLLAATMEYTVGDHHWSHSFVTKRLDDDYLATLLAEVGLRLAGFVAGDRGWVRAVPAAGATG